MDKAPQSAPERPWDDGSLHRSQIALAKTTKLVHGFGSHLLPSDEWLRLEGMGLHQVEPFDLGIELR